MVQRKAVVELEVYGRTSLEAERALVGELTHWLLSRLTGSAVVDARSGVACSAEGGLVGALASWRIREVE